MTDFDWLDDIKGETWWRTLGTARGRQIGPWEWANIEDAIVSYRMKTMTTTEAAAIQGENEMTATTAEFFLALRDETTVWCSEHNAAVSTWQPGPAFANRDEAEEFIANSREWYDSESGPDHCLFRHDHD